MKSRLSYVTRSVTTLIVWLIFIAHFGQSHAQMGASLTVEQVEEALVKTRNLKPMIDLSIRFEFDSATLLDQSKPNLRVIADAFNGKKLGAYSFQVEGHTDKQGMAQYNQRLSERRADAVVTFLVNVGVQRERLTAVGKGFHELADETNPTAAENRRVRIRTQP